MAAEETYKQVDYRIESIPYDTDGKTFIFLDSENGEEIGRENLSKYILIMTGKWNLVSQHPNELEIHVTIDASGRVIGMDIERRSVQ